MPQLEHLEAIERRLWEAADTLRANSNYAVSAWGRLGKVHYFWSQVRWLTERFPTAELRDVPGLVKLVDRAEIEANDWSLTPGRYVGVAPEAEDENFDFASVPCTPNSTVSTPRRSSWPRRSRRISRSWEYERG